MWQNIFSTLLPAGGVKQAARENHFIHWISQSTSGNRPFIQFRDVPDIWPDTRIFRPFSFLYTIHKDPGTDLTANVLNYLKILVVTNLHIFGTENKHLRGVLP
jgi:hypothetical protein